MRFPRDLTAVLNLLFLGVIHAVSLDKELGSSEFFQPFEPPMGADSEEFLSLFAADDIEKWTQQNFVVLRVFMFRDEARGADFFNLFHNTSLQFDLLLRPVQLASFDEELQVNRVLADDVEKSFLTPTDLRAYSSCIYEGEIRNLPSSLVILNLCQRIRGFLQYKDANGRVFNIEIVSTSERHSYMLLSRPLENDDSIICQEPDPRAVYPYPLRVPTVYRTPRLLPNWRRLRLSTSSFSRSLWRRRRGFALPNARLVLIADKNYVDLLPAGASSKAETLMLYFYSKTVSLTIIIRRPIKTESIPSHQLHYSVNPTSNPYSRSARLKTCCTTTPHPNYCELPR